MKKPSSKNTKAEILAAYRELDEAHRQLLKEKHSGNAKDADTPRHPKPTEKHAEKNAEKSEMKAVIEALEHLGETFNTAVSRLSGDLLVEAFRLKEKRSWVETETHRLAGLYDLEIGEDTLGELLRQYTDTANACEKAFQEKREATEKELAEKRRVWKGEKEDILRQMMEQKASDKRSRERETSEYRYALALTRGASDESGDRQKKELEQALEDLRETRHAEWEERENQLAEREKAFKEHKEKVENFPKELEDALKKAKEEGIGIARKQAKIKADLRAKEIAGEQAVYELKIKTLEEEIVKQAARIESLSQQLEIATRQAQELAVKAIEGASSQTSFRELKELAMEQAKNPTKGK